MSFRKNIAAIFSLVGMKPPLSLEKTLNEAIGRNDGKAVSEIFALSPSLLEALPAPESEVPQIPGAIYMSRALDRKNFAAAKALAEAFPSILTAADSSGVTFSMYFAQAARFEESITGMMGMLDSMAADAIDKQGNKLLHYAAMNENLVGAVKAVLPLTGKDINLPNKKGETPLMLVAAYGESDGQQLLLDNKADVHMKDQSGLNATMYAIRHSNLDNAIALLKLKGVVDFSDEAVETQLRVATFEGKFEFAFEVEKRRQMQPVEQAEEEMRLQAAALLEKTEKQKQLVGEVVAAVKQGTRAIEAPVKASFAKRQV